MTDDLRETQPTGEVTWQPLRHADAPALTELMAAAEAVDKTGENYDEDDVVEDFMNDLVNLEEDTRLVWKGERLIAFAAVFGMRRVSDVHAVFASGTVHPDCRRRGLGRELLRWGLARAERLHTERHPSVPANLIVGVPETNAGLAALAKSEGLEEIRFWFDMVRPLQDPDPPLPEVQPAHGVRIEGFDMGRNEDVRAAHNTAFAGHFGSTERVPDEWQHYFTGARAFRPDLSLLAIEDDPDAAVAGYLLAYVYAADVLANGRREVYLGQLGTLPEFRGRGLGSALLATALGNWAASGHQVAILGVDTANGTGALGLYERAGFTVHKRTTSWGRRIPAST